MRQYECAVEITRAAFVFITHCNRLCNYHSYLLDIDWSLPHSIHIYQKGEYAQSLSDQGCGMNVSSHCGKA